MLIQIFATQVLSPQMIIFRVTTGRSWSTTAGAQDTVALSQLNFGPVLSNHALSFADETHGDNNHGSSSNFGTQSHLESGISAKQIGQEKGDGERK